VSGRVLADARKSSQSNQDEHGMVKRRHFGALQQSNDKKNDAPFQSALETKGLSHDIARISINAPSRTGRNVEALQTKLAISQPGDIFEQEADNVAEQIMRIQEKPIHSNYPISLNDNDIRVKEIPGHIPANRPGTGISPMVHEAVNSPGQPLDTATRTHMEALFGHDFSQVRISTDRKAAESAQSINALAYAVGQRIIFGENRYAPGTREGLKLLSHELTHTIQQESVNRISRQEKSESSASSFNLFNFLEMIGNPQNETNLLIRTINQLDKDEVAAIIKRLNGVGMLRKLAGSNSGTEILGAMKEKISTAIPGKEERTPFSDKVAEFNLLIDALTFRSSNRSIVSADERLIIARLNNAIMNDPDFSKYGFTAVPLRFPVEIYPSFEYARDGGVYYDPNLNSGKSAVTVNQSINLTDGTRTTRNLYPVIFIKFGPKSVIKNASAGTASEKYHSDDSIRSIMWHEFVHYRRFESFRKPDSHKSPEEITLESEVTDRPNAEVEAYSVQLSKYFDVLTDPYIEENLNSFADYLNDAYDPLLINQAIERIYLAVATVPLRKERILRLIRKHKKRSKLNKLETAIVTGTYVKALPVRPVPGKGMESVPGY
jgi:hypothetical protein